MDEIRGTMLKTGAAAATPAAAPQVFAQETGQGTAKFYEKGSVRIAYQDVGSGFPLLLIAGGGLNSKMAGLATSPFNPIEEFKGEYRCIASDLRNASGGRVRPFDFFFISFEIFIFISNTKIKTNNYFSWFCLISSNL